MSRRKWWVIAALFTIVLLCGAAVILGYLRPSLKTYADADGVKMKFKTEGTSFLVYEDDEVWKEVFAKGVNLGATVPGHYPGELPATEEDYLRWFKQIDDMGANVIRVYTVHNPVFYSALVKYNRDKGDDPLYFMQGIWSPEEQLIERKDAYDEEIIQTFKAEISKAVAAVYGDINVEPKHGQSSGKYKVNAGKYLMAWHVGTEWDPTMVDNTNTVHKDVPQYEGSYFSGTKDASPFENWLASLLDYTAAEEQKYGWQHPMTFTNWVTTDVLEHPGEPLFEEDLVSVDARHVEPVNWNAGYFAAYHVYPYYPDFFRTDKTLQTLPDGNGGYNTYKAYLRKLKAEFEDMPIMVTEYGVPSSIGISHHGPGGKDQGGHDEAEQGEVNVSLTQDIYDEGYSGAILFMWQDEWFKKTWNTMPFEIPADRRAFWLNVLTNEKMFGVLAMQPGKVEQITIDGDLSDWDKVPEGEVKTWSGTAPGVKNMRLTHDEAYLYIGMELEEAFDPERSKLFIGADTIPGGDIPKKELAGRTLQGGALETLIQLGQEDESQVTIAPSYDFHSRLYGKEGYWMLPEEEAKGTKDDPVVPGGSFHAWKLAISLLMNPPDTRFSHPFVDEKVGMLKQGTSDPKSPDFNSLTAWQYQDRFVEMRIPWMLLGFGDPSSLQVVDYSPLQDKRTFSTITTEGIRLAPWIAQRSEKNGKSASGSAASINLEEIEPYTWELWEATKYSERLKQSYYDMQDIFTRLSEKEREPDAK
ncbi:hypothetical protein [Paenibacillus lautus]|uniref:hypothetical protein n=1 Tax=Paenibacillus lautus TaxID=1401 RepID=UPI002DB5ACF9|nr:hypothetical protein [Paenibacillus lautus]MEC0255154.1 hypothetical protein [Paenibacillus lautus]